MKTKILIAILSIGLFTASTMKAQEMDHSKMKKDTTKMEMKAMYSCPMKCEGDKKYEKLGNCPKCKMDLKKTEMKPVYTCSMHPEVVSDKKGECPKCGMKLIEKKMEMKKEKEDSHKGHNH
ncbi:heavy metal-binding domain-containing protein [Lutibacter sp.]|uniref:heavy metal-binding domain-containing protein n=1 Tax=Lutibacter sp. TaxID=1925666 RepID=UPI00273401E6|nr:heavy metal-binding domain-containing protein [Lutibacter sp.]MDP3312019.1 heavy metal-binding domain-containing protein [Lutibacter sp.]